MAIIETLSPRVEHLGEIPVRRVLPNASRTMVGPFIFMDQGGPSRIKRTTQSGVGEHPHAGLCTFTYLLDGHGHHLDSAGHDERIETGDIALMTAGRGVTHEERPHPDDPATELDIYFVQMWIALPESHEDMAPAFERHLADKIPKISGDGIEARVLIGEAWGLIAPTTQYSPTLFCDVLLQRDTKIEIENRYEERALYILEGTGQIGGAQLYPHTLSVLQSGASLTLESEVGCRAVLFGGDGFPSPRFIAGSFVGSSMAKLRQWDADYRAGRFPRIER
ncbi:MAG: pirin family protein [Pseudomonadota bacterium]